MEWWNCSKVDCGDGCTTLWIYEKPLNHTLYFLFLFFLITHISDTMQYFFLWLISLKECHHLHVEVTEVHKQFFWQIMAFLPPRNSSTMQSIVTKLNGARSRGIEHCSHAHSSFWFSLATGSFFRNVAVISPFFVHFYRIFTVTSFNPSLWPPFIKLPTSFYFLNNFLYLQ